MNNSNKFFLKLFATFFIIFFAFNLFSGLVLARELETGYPEIDGYKPETVEETSLPEYVIYLFKWAIIIGGIIVFGALVWGGIRWMTSVGNPTQLGDAHGQILAGFIGIIILLLSWLILNTIDPELTNLDIKKLARIKATEMIGVYLSPKESFPSEKEIADGTQKAYYIIDSIANLSLKVPKEETIKSLKLVNQVGFAQLTPKDEECPTGMSIGPLEECISIVDGFMKDLKCCKPEEEPEDPSFFYGVVLHEKRNMEGDCSIYRSVGLNKITHLNVSPAPESVTVFQEAESSSGEVIAYENQDRLGESLTLIPNPPGYLAADAQWQSLGNLAENIGSIEMKGDFLLVLKGDKGCMIIPRNSSNLKEWLNFGFYSCNCTMKGFWTVCSPCVTEYALFPLGYEEQSSLSPTPGPTPSPGPTPEPTPSPVPAPETGPAPGMMYSVMSPDACEGFGGKAYEPCETYCIATPGLCSPEISICCGVKK